MKRLLVIVDYQRDFVVGSLGFPQARELEEPIIKKIQKYAGRGDDVVFTLDTHKSDYEQTQEGRKLPVAHCIQGTPGWELYGRVKDFARGRKWFLKEAFGSGEFYQYLLKQNFKQIEFVGLVSYICVISNAVLAKTALPEALITVDSACTAGPDQNLHQAALDVMDSLQIQII